MPRWNADSENVSKNFLFLGLLLILTTSLAYFAIMNFFANPSKTIQVINVMGSCLLLIYVVGRFYGETYKHRDFVDLSSDGLTFRETPSFGLGWMPITRQMKFEEIKSADIVELQSFFHPDKKKTALLLWPRIGKQVIIGSHLSKSQIVKVGLALRGTVMLSNSLEKLIGLEKVESTIRGVFEGAKKIYDKYQVSKGEEKDG